MKNCPYCWEKIQNEAKKCRFCWEWIDSKYNTKTKKSQSESKNRDTSERAKTNKTSSHGWLLLRIWDNFFSKNIDVNSAILTAFWWSIVSIGITLIYILANGGWTTNWWSSLWDVVFMSLLAWGIYKKNRACAIGIFIYFLIGKIYQINLGSLNWVGVIVWLVFLSIFFLGIRWTLRYHKEMWSEKLDTREIVAIVLICIALILMMIWLSAS